MEILYGLHPVLEALRAGKRNIREIYLAGKNPEQRFQAVLDLAAARGIPFRSAAPDFIQKKSGTDKHQGLAALVEPLPLSDELTIIEHYLANPGPSFILLIDSVQDPHNLGALIRTAVCLGASGVIIPKDRAANPSPTVSKASAGALEHVRLARATNLAACMGTLRKRSIWLIGADARADKALFQCDLTGPLALVIGGEEKGLRPLVQKNCDLLVSIPQSGPINSLNASVAGAVVMYEAIRQRFQKLVAIF